MPAQNRGESWPKDHSGLASTEADQWHQQMRLLKTGGSRGPKTTRAWPARRQTNGTSRCACSFCIYLSGSGVRLGPHRRRLAKKKAPPPPLGQGRRRGHPRCGLDSRIFDAETGHSFPHLSCGLDSRIFDAENGPLFSASLMRTPLPHRIFHA